MVAGYLSRLLLAYAVLLTIKTLHLHYLLSVAIRLDSALAHISYHCSAEIDWSSVNSRPRWFPYNFEDCRVYTLVEEGVPSQRRDASRVFGAVRL